MTNEPSGNGESTEAMEDTQKFTYHHPATESIVSAEDGVGREYSELPYMGDEDQSALYRNPIVITQSEIHITPTAPIVVRGEGETTAGLDTEL